MATCPCGADLPPRRGPRARVYCSRACQQRAYRSRQHQQQQRDVYRPAPGDTDRLLARYDGVPATDLADQLARSARRLADALTVGQDGDGADLDVVTQVPAVLAARARHAAPAAQDRPRSPETGTEPSRDDRRRPPRRPVRAPRTLT